MHVCNISTQMYRSTKCVREPQNNRYYVVAGAPDYMRRTNEYECIVNLTILCFYERMLTITFSNNCQHIRRVCNINVFAALRDTHTTNKFRAWWRVDSHRAALGKTHQPHHAIRNISWWRRRRLQLGAHITGVFPGARTLEHAHAPSKQLHASCTEFSVLRCTRKQTVRCIFHNQARRDATRRCLHACTLGKSLRSAKKLFVDGESLSSRMQMRISKVQPVGQSVLAFAAAELSTILL